MDTAPTADGHVGKTDQIAPPRRAKPAAIYLSTMRPPTEGAYFWFTRFGGFALVLVGDFIVVVCKIAHQNSGVGALHLDRDTPQLRGAISPMFRVVCLVCLHRPCSLCGKQSEYQIDGDAEFDERDGA
jgi:hypothetical protein